MILQGLWKGDERPPMHLLQCLWQHRNNEDFQ